MNQVTAEKTKTPRIEIIVLLLIASVLASFILRDDATAPMHPMDQSFVYIDLKIAKSETGTWRFDYPHLQYSGGISSSLLIGVYKLIFSPSNQTLNWHARLLGCAVYLVACLTLLNLMVEGSVLICVQKRVRCQAGGWSWYEVDFED